MGACEFFDVGYGDNHRTVFNSLVEEAEYEYGHGGYTGTIAEKQSYKVIGEVHESKDSAMAEAQKLMDEDDRRVSDKWGPAGCIEFKSPRGRGFVFFGWASS